MFVFRVPPFFAVCALQCCQQSVCVRPVHDSDLGADTLSALCSCLVKRSQKEEPQRVTTQRVNLHYGPICSAQTKRNSGDSHLLFVRGNKMQ